MTNFASSDLVAAGFCHGGFAEASEQRSHEEYAAAQCGAFAYILVAVEVVEVERVGLECVVVA